jgi:DNA replicative helicase MCM subunit Mcm2 (Cdc46/Mcm family)
MKGYINDQSIILTDTLPDNLQEGDEVEITITEIKKKNYPFPTFDLGVKEQYLNREKIYEKDSNLP